MSDEFKKEIVKHYAEDKQWRRIMDVLENNNDNNDPPEEEYARMLRLRFCLRKHLIHYTNFDDGRERLCIPAALEKKVFEMAHDRQSHAGYHRTYERNQTT